MCASDVRSPHTHINHSFGDVKSYGLKGEGTRDWKGRCGVRMKHMTTLESHEFSFFLHILYL